MKNTKVINLLSGPGCGKSVLMARLFAELKILGYDVEMAPEFAKEKVWEGSLEVLSDQIYVFGKQLHRINRLLGKVDFIICDSPLLLSAIYDTTGDPIFKELIVHVINKMDNKNYFIKRDTTYNPIGRIQTEKEAIEIDNRILELLKETGMEFREINKDNALNEILKDNE